MALLPNLHECFSCQLFLYGTIKSSTATKVGSLQRESIVDAIHFYGRYVCRFVDGTIAGGTGGGQMTRTGDKTERCGGLSFKRGYISKVIPVPFS